MDIFPSWLSRLALRLSLATLSACGGPALHTILEFEKEAVVTIAGGFECDPAGLEAVGAIVRPSRQTLCSGALITDDTVLTAAHCVEGEDPAKLSFVIGAEPQTAVGLPIAGWSGTPDTRETRAAPTTSLCSSFGSPCQGSLLCPTERPRCPSTSGALLTFAGFGNNDGAGKTGSGIKRCVRMPISRVNEFTFQNQTPGRNSCHGDSGGPVLDYRNGKWEIVGVIASGDSLCERIGFSARVDVAAEWIAQTAAPSHASTGSQ